MGVPSKLVRKRRQRVHPRRHIQASNREELIEQVDLHRRPDPYLTVRGAPRGTISASNLTEVPGCSF